MFFSEEDLAFASLALKPRKHVTSKGRARVFFIYERVFILVLSSLAERG